MKFLPIIGEIYTAIQSGVLITSAGVAKVCGLDESAENLKNSAGKCWVEYKDTNFVACYGRMIYHGVREDYEKVDEIEKTIFQNTSSLVDSIPVVGHIKGGIHHICGDVEGAKRAYDVASRSTVVVGAGMLTGGLGAPLVAGAAAAISAGTVYDGAATVIVKNNDESSRARGVFALCEDDVKPIEVFDSLITPVGDGLAGAGGVKLGRNLVTRVIEREKYASQRSIKRAFKNSELTKKTGIDARKATKHVMETGKKAFESREGVRKSQAANTQQSNNANTGSNQPNLKKSCTTRSTCTETNKSATGHSTSHVVEKNQQNLGSQKYSGSNKAIAKKIRSNRTYLAEKYPDIPEDLQKAKVRDFRNCAEQDSMNNLSKKVPDLNDKNVISSTVRNVDGKIVTEKACSSCKLFMEKTGAVLTEFIANDIEVSPIDYVHDGYTARSAIGAAIGSKMASNS